MKPPTGTIKGAGSLSDLDLLEIVSCPLCDTVNTPYAYEESLVKGSTVFLGLNHCSRCRMNYVSPRLTNAGREIVYASYDASVVSGAYNVDPEVSRREYDVFSRYLDTYVRDRQSSVLDIGCGVGNFLDTLVATGWRALEGVEFAGEAVEAARRKGHRVAHGSLMQQGYSANSFSCAVMMNVLEHVPDPLGHCREVFKVLKPGGWFIVAVPDLRYLALMNRIGLLRRLVLNRKATLFPQEHLQNFTPETIAALLRAAGFEIVRFYVGPPKMIGSLPARLFKRIASILLRCAGLDLGGIHVIAKKAAAS